jgi:quercetin dioxygenase-like cupin family protein
VEGIVQRSGDGEPLFGGRIVLRADFEQLCMTESHFDRARAGAGPHLHRQHADSFYVLEGELAFLVDDEEVLLGPGGCACAPAGVVHGFRSTSRARFLNVHTPHGGFAENLRARDRGEPGGFDSVDVEPGTGLPASQAIVVEPGGGERLAARTRVATIKIGRDELALVEFELEPGFEGPPLHTHDHQLDSFYVLEGEAGFQMGDERVLLDAGSFVAAPPGVLHTFSGGPGPCRLLNSTRRAPASTSGSGRLASRARANESERSRSRWTQRSR